MKQSVGECKQINFHNLCVTSESCIHEKIFTNCNILIVFKCVNYQHQMEILPVPFQMLQHFL